MSLIAELKRRKVFKVGAAYLVAGWLLIQVAATVAPQLNLPEWAPRLITLVVLLGFPIVLVMAWVFDMTAEGLRADTSGAGSKPMFVAAALLAALALGWYFHRQSPSQTVAMTATVATMPAVAEKSIAVMPFLNMSAEKEQDYFSDGMTEEILNALAKVPKLEVTARTSVFSLKGQNHDVRELGKLLGVAYLLEGSVRKAGDEVRITAQLIRTDNGFHLWSETYDRKLENVFALQAELAGAIAQALQLPLGMGGSDGLVSERTADAQAYAMFLQARSAYRARGDGVKQSIELYRAALKRDPKFAPAWAGLASSLAVLPWYVGEAEKADTPQFMREAEQAAAQALALAPDLPQAHTALATVYNFEWKWALAEPHFQRALALAPNDPEVHYNYADWLAVQGRLDEALQEAQRTVALDPLVPIFLNGNANAFQDLSRDKEALALREAAYALAPNVLLISNNLVSAYIRAGRLEDAERVLDQSHAAALAFAAQHGLKTDPQSGYRLWIRAVRDPSFRQEVGKDTDDIERFNRLESALGDIDAAFATIQTAMDKHTSGVDPVIQLRSRKFDPYHKDPRYLRLLHKAGFDDEGNIR